MQIPRFHTQAGRGIYDGVRFRAVPGGQAGAYTVPQDWDEAAAETLITRVFHPGLLPGGGYETDIRKVLDRVAGAFTLHGQKTKLFGTAEDAAAFYDELRFLMLHQMAAPETAQWARAGLDLAYGIEENKFIPAQRITALENAEAGAGALADTGRDALKRVDLLDRKLSLENGGRTAVTLPVESADSAAFARRRRDAELDALALDLGRRMMKQALDHVVKSGASAQAVEEARDAGLDDATITMAIALARQGRDSVPLPDSPDTQDSHIMTVLSVPDSFVEAALTGHGFMLREDGAPLRRCDAAKLWDDIAAAAWAGGEPAVFFRDHASKNENFAPSATGGFVFRPGTEAPAATINLAAFLKPEGGTDAPALAHAATVMMAALECSFGCAHVSPATLESRPLVLGVTNVAAFLMAQGLAYDSDAGRAAAASAVALVSGAAHGASAEMGACAGYAARAKETLKSIRDKMAALSDGGGAAPRVRPSLCPDRALLLAARAAWQNAYMTAQEKGLRHLHLTAVDVDMESQALLGARTRGCAPETEIVIFGERKTLNPLVPRALKALGYGARAAEDIGLHATGRGTLEGSPGVNHDALKKKGFHRAALDAVGAALKSARDVRYAFNRWTLGADFCRAMLGFSDEDLDDPGFEMLQALGFSEAEIEAANLWCCGAGGMAGAPGLNPAHLPVFAPASPASQVAMLAAVQPFLSGSAVHVIELKQDAGIDEARGLLLNAWSSGLKYLRLWRDLPPLMAGIAEEEIESPVPALRQAAS